MAAFIALPYRLYKDEPKWIAPLLLSQKSLFDLKKNPFWKTCDHVFFIAIKNGKTVGRIACIFHHDYFKTAAEPTGFFGFLDAEDDPDVFKNLLHNAEAWLGTRSCQKIIGPVNPSINYEMGTLISGFEFPPYLMMTYNFEYYNKRIVAEAYTKEMDFFAYYTGKNAPTLSGKMDRIIELTQKKYALHLRPVSKSKFYTELDILHNIYNDAFSKHYGFVAMTKDEFMFMGKDMAKIVDEQLLLIAEYNKEPIGFILALPNYNEVFGKIKNGKLFPGGWLKFLYYKSKIKSIRILTIAIKQKYRHLGVGAYLYREIIRTSAEKKMEHGEMSWIAENNIQMNKAALEMGAVLTKKYRLYCKQLS